jgi:hypothetical protein
MYYLVGVYRNGMAVSLTRSDWRVFLKSAVYPMQWMGLMMICCGLWDGSEEDGNVKTVR